MAVVNRFQIRVIGGPRDGLRLTAEEHGESAGIGGSEPVPAGYEMPMGAVYFPQGLDAAGYDFDADRREVWHRSVRRCAACNALGEIEWPENDGPTRCSECRGKGWLLKEGE